MKILIVTSEFGKQGGGLSKSCYIFVHLLQSIGFDIKIVISTYISTLETTVPHVLKEFKIIQNTIEITSGGYKPNLHTHLFFRGHIYNVINQLEKEPPDLIIAFGAGYNGLFADELQRTIHCKLIVMLRGSEVNLSITDNELFFANQKCFKNASAVIALSEELLHCAKEIYFNPTIIYKVVPNIIQFEEKPQIKKMSISDIILGTGAKNLNEKKGIANLIKVIYYLNNLNNQHKFYLELAGYIDNDLFIKYQELAELLKISKYIKFLGNLEHNEFLSVVENWDFVIQGSFCEGFSNTLAEAISIGKPFMMTNTGYIAENLKNITPELIFTDFNPQTIAQRIYENYFSGKFLTLTNTATQYLKPLVNHDHIQKEWQKIFTEINLQNIKFSISNEHILSVILHDISPKYYSNIDMPSQSFDSLCQKVYQKGFSFCSARTYFQSSDRNNLIICTFDDAYQGVYDFAFPTLKKYKFTATIFVCSDYIGRVNNWNHKDKQTRKHISLDNLKELKDSDWEIGSHGTNHVSFLRLDTLEIIETLQKSKSLLSEYFGEVVSFAYPYGDYNPYISRLSKKFYENIFAVNTGGTHIFLDRQQIRRYSTDELNQILTV